MKMIKYIWLAIVLTFCVPKKQYKNRVISNREITILFFTENQDTLFNNEEFSKICLKDSLCFSSNRRNDSFKKDYSNESLFQTKIIWEKGRFAICLYGINYKKLLFKYDNKIVKVYNTFGYKKYYKKFKKEVKVKLKYKINKDDERFIFNQLGIVK